jgi:hypothetical protein
MTPQKETPQAGNLRRQGDGVNTQRDFVTWEVSHA